jgi:hypothetical protein
MSAFVKTYPRAKVSQNTSRSGWVIDLIQRAGAKPKRVSATYSSIAWANKAARTKLPARQAPKPQPARGLELFERPKGAKGSTGICTPCGRPMRPVGTKAADHPGTTLRQREGLCQSCYQRAAREGTQS